MDKLDQELSEQVKRVAGTLEADSYSVMSGEVVSVDESAGTCVVQMSIDEPGAPTSGVLLNAVSGNANGLLLIPKTGSKVWVAEIDGPGKWGLVKCSDLTKVLVKAETIVEFNGGENGGVPIASNTATKINTVITSLNNLRTIMDTWVPVVNDGGNALKLLLGTWLSELLDTVAASDLENTDVKH